MYENLRGKSCVRFTAELASSAPVPGGGSVTALLGALTAAAYGRPLPRLARKALTAAG